MSDLFDIKQTDRLLNIEWSGGTDTMILTRFTGTERLSTPFSFQLDVVSPLDAITPDQIVGTEIGWSVRMPGGDRRAFAGVVAALGEGTSFGRGYRRYSLDVVPAFWLLTHTANCKIFQNQTVPQIIAAVLGGHPEVKFDLGGLSGSYQPRVYCVQYCESDFAFVCRLMEDEGIFYYFRHAEDSHVMVLGDSSATWFSAMPGTVHYGIQPDVEGTIGRWYRRSRFRGGRWTQRDYNFETPGNSLNASVTTILTPSPFKQYEYYDYPGGYMDARTGDTRSLLRMEAEESGFREVEAESNIMQLGTGGHFSVDNYEYSSDSAGGWVVLSITHRATDYSHVTGEGSSEQPSYTNGFQCFDDSVKYRPPRMTARPRIPGLQIATVVGPAGEEIYTDQYGRIKVQFPWDRLGQFNESSSCWMRVVQMLGGGQWGGEFIPRIGMVSLSS